MVDQPVDGSGRGHGVLEDPVPLREDQVAGDYDAATLVAFAKECEEDLHLITVLLDVAYVVKDHYIEAVEAA